MKPVRVPRQPFPAAEFAQHIVVIGLLFRFQIRYPSPDSDPDPHSLVTFRYLAFNEFQKPDTARHQLSFGPFLRQPLTTQPKRERIGDESRTQMISRFVHRDILCKNKLLTI